MTFPVWHEYYAIWTEVICLQPSSGMSKNLFDIIEAYTRYRNALIPIK